MTVRSHHIARSWLLAAAAGVGLASAASAQTTLTLSSWVPPSHTLTTSQAEWCAMLEQKVPGKIKCNVLPRAVSAAPGTFDAVRNGLADMSFVVHGYTPGRFTYTQMVEVPFLGDSAEATSVAFQRIYNKVPQFAEEHKGVKVIPGSFLAQAGRDGTNPGANFIRLALVQDPATIKEALERLVEVLA